MPLDDLDDSERRFYAPRPPWEVVEFGLDLGEYVAKVRQDQAAADFNGEDERGDDHF